LNKLKIKAEFYIKKPSETVYQQKFIYLWWHTCNNTT